MTDRITETIVRFRSVPLERTPQRLDPLGVQSAWPLLPLLGVTAIGYAAFSIVLHHNQLRSPVLAAVALGVLVLAVVTAGVRTYPGLAPVGLWSHLAIVGMALASACLFAAAVWGRNHRIQDDAGQIAVALLVAVMPLYRPVGEALGVAAACGTVLGALAALQAPSGENNPLVYATVAATPVLALACGGAGYAWTMTGETLRWREVARAGQGRLDGELRQTAARMILQERATALNAAAVPFLSELVASGSVTAEDRERARRIADELRAAAVAAVERTWLAETLALALASCGRDTAPGRSASRVHDPDRLDRVLSDEQRAIVSALLATLAGLPGLDAERVRVVVSEPERPLFTLTARVRKSRRELRRELLPILSVLRSAGLTATMQADDDGLTVRIAYPGTPIR
ncbi:hypothetical protein O159_23850 [Leifsonia xyli subsp. cynodontis DSM 46306]|uniref:Uncharacterized protein n=1 Tax=Leifsonia xyli subsp. cynodontis DSM 46306 TaxID=1389489 RepID=U3PA06_LEIXC|nr:hypothetical protein [Leifsonia xyli]AGW42344.1 hypothetical protein O159_23850 [Leifsonia xyli subsp. cynodontis DSM 46306]